MSSSTLSGASAESHRPPTLGRSPLLHGGHVDTDDSLVAVLVGDHGERWRVAVIDDGPARGDGGGDPVRGHLGRHVNLDVEPLAGGAVLVGVPEPEVRYPSRSVADFVAGRTVALGAGAPGQQGGPDWGNGRGARRVEAELDVAYGSRVGLKLMV